jgi:CRISPR system Cascade subunit CasE
MRLHLIELQLDLRALHLWASRRGMATPVDQGLALHHLLGDTFGPQHFATLPASGWTLGQRLGFDLRARAVVRRASALSGKTENGNAVSFHTGAEGDASLAAALRERKPTRESLYLEWLAEKLGPAAAPDLTASRLTSFERSRVQRHSQRLEGPDAVIHGTLTILDPLAFAGLLARAICRHRSDGYGMLLLRPPQRRG